MTDSDDDLRLERVAEPCEDLEGLTADFGDHFGG
jgi:hypothetical protein